MTGFIAPLIATSRNNLYVFLMIINQK
jgi:hypothetical protein